MEAHENPPASDNKIDYSRSTFVTHCPESTSYDLVSGDHCLSAAGVTAEVVVCSTKAVLNLTQGLVFEVFFCLFAHKSELANTNRMIHIDLKRPITQNPRAAVQSLFQGHYSVFVHVHTAGCSGGVFGTHKWIRRTITARPSTRNRAVVDSLGICRGLVGMIFSSIAQLFMNKARACLPTVIKSMSCTWPEFEPEWVKSTVCRHNLFRNGSTAVFNHGRQ